MNIAIWRLMPDDTFRLLTSWGTVEWVASAETGPTTHGATECYEIDGISYWKRNDGLTVGIEATGGKAFRVIQRVVAAFEEQYPDWQTRFDAMPLEDMDDVWFDPIETIESDLNETNSVMIDALDYLLRRGERLEAIQSTSSRLRESSEMFRRKVDRLWTCCSCPLM